MTQLTESSARSLIASIAAPAAVRMDPVAAFQIVVPVTWRQAEVEQPRPFKTVLLFQPKAEIEMRVETGYWDGFRWCDFDGEPVEGITWWADLPVAPIHCRG